MITSANVGSGIPKKVAKSSTKKLTKRATTPMSAARGMRREVRKLVGKKGTAWDVPKGPKSRRRHAGIRTGL